MRTLPIFMAFLFAVPANAQKRKTVETVPADTKAEDRLAGYQHRLRLEEKSLVANIPFRNIGPVVFGGRVTDLDVKP